jgi:hypothetical protein
MDEATLQAWLAAQGVNNAGMPIGTNPSSNLSVYNSILGIAQDPRFLLQQGFITPDEMLQYVLGAINEPVLKTSDYDVEGYRASTPTDNIRLQGAYDLLDAGMTPSQVKAKLIEDIAGERGGQLLTTDVQIVEEQSKDIEEYYRRLTNDIERRERIASGEWFEGPGGTIMGTRDDARSVLSALDFGGIAGIPQMWRPVLDPELAALAEQQLQEAEAARQTRITKGRQAAKETGAVGQKAYMDFLMQVPQGPGPRPKTPEPEKIPEMGTREYQEYISRKTEDVLLPGASFAPPGPKSGQFEGQPRLEGNSNAAIISRLTPAEQDYWAKMAASYAGRAAQESSLTQKQAAQAGREAEEKWLASQESAKQAMEKATTPALEALMNAPSIAAMLAQPTSKPAYVKPKPRVLSDQEIETMATMIAGGMQ